MRHRNHSQRLSQKPHHAWMMLRNMLTSILLYEHIRTTKKRAQVLKPLVDEIITIGKGDNAVLAIRRINEMVTDDNACRKVLEVFKPRYADRVSGFTRIKAVGMRQGDGAKLVDMMLVEGKDVEPAVTRPSSARRSTADSRPATSDDATSDKKTSAKKSSSKKA